MDFSLPPHVKEFQHKLRRFVADGDLPLEAEKSNYDLHDHIKRATVLNKVREKAKALFVGTTKCQKARGGQSTSLLVLRHVMKR